MSKLPSTNQNDIPTLTDLVKENGQNAGKPADPVENVRREPVLNSPDGTAVHDIDRNQLEKLIYKKLHQSLPQLCQQLAREILREFESLSSPGPDDTGKHKHRR